MFGRDLREHVEKRARVARMASSIAALGAALPALPLHWRRALLLCHLEGLDECAIAEALDRAPEDVPSVLDRWRAFLRRRLAEVDVAGPRPGAPARPSLIAPVACPAAPRGPAPAR